MYFVSLNLSAICALVLIANCNGLPIQQIVASATEAASTTTKSFDSQYSTTNGALDYTSSSNSLSSSYAQDYDYVGTDTISQQAIDNYIKSQQNIDQTADYLAQQQWQQQQTTLDLYPTNSNLNPLDDELYKQTIDELNYEAEHTQTVYNNINLTDYDSSDSDSDDSS